MNVIHAARSAPARLAHLDALRGLAALIVLVAHLGGVSSYALSPYVHALFPHFDLGHFGVSLFFITSGYVISISLEQTSFRGFWRRRFLRLYPSYWISIGLFLLLIATNRGAPNSPQYYEAPAAFMLANATMLQPLLGVDHLLIVYWTLTYELLFYMLVSLLHLLRLFRHSLALSLVVMGLAVTLDALSPQIGIGQPADPSLFALMFTGVVLYHVRQQRTPRAVGYFVVAACGALFIAMGALLGSPANVVRARELALLVFMLFFVWEWRPAALCWLGAISYPLYLFHFIVVAFIGSHGLLLDSVLWAGCSILLAWAVHAWVERPLIRLGRGPSRLAIEPPAPPFRSQITSEHPETAP